MSAAVQLNARFGVDAVQNDNTAQRVDSRAENYDAIVIGGGQAGLAVGYYLARRQQRFAILDANERVGDSWRKRWDSLRLFSPARFDALVGMPFPAPPDSFPTHEEMADYLEAYAKRFALPVKNNMRVQSLRYEDGRYVIEASGQRFVAKQVVVAMGNYQVPVTPSLASQLGPQIRQFHSSRYQNPAQLQPGGVLVVGAGNSGAEVAIELAKQGRAVWVAGPETGEVPFKMSSFWGRWVFARLLFRVLFHRILTIRTPMGRKARPKALGSTTPLIRTRTSDLLRAGVQRGPRVSGAVDGRPVLEDGTQPDVTNVIWCTGFTPGFDWIDLPIFDADGLPRHEAGVVPGYPGLCFVGLHFLYSMSSGMIHGVSRDAERITRHLSNVI